MSDSEEEYEYYDYGRDRDDKDEIIVAGGGMMNGNAYATVKLMDDGYIRYHEYGKNSFSKMYRNHYLDWHGDNFNIEKKKKIVSMSSWASDSVFKDDILLGKDKGDKLWYNVNPNTMEKGGYYGSIVQSRSRPKASPKASWASGGFMEHDGKMLGMIKKTGDWYFMDPVTMAKGEFAFKLVPQKN